MTMPRRQLVDVAVTRYYHCISRCVRRAFLCGEGVTHRKAWIEARLEVLAQHFAVSVCGFAILDNHLHNLCRLDPGIAKTPEAAPRTSIKQRVNHVRRNGDLDTLHAAAAAEAVAAARIEADLEQSHWLCPLQDRTTAGAAREGMLPGISLSSYLELVDWTARLCRPGKARLTTAVAGIMARLGTSPEYWQVHLQKLLGKTRWLGRYCATSAERLKAIAEKRGVHHVDNALSSLATG